MTPPLPTIHGINAFRLWLRDLIEFHGLTVVAEKYGLSRQHLWGLANKEGALGQKTVQRFGYRREDTAVFTPIEQEKTK